MTTDRGIDAKPQLLRFLPVKLTTSRYKQVTATQAITIMWKLPLSFTALIKAVASFDSTTVRVRTFWPNHASTAHQVADPASVMILNVVKFICMIPAGIEIIWRMTGNRRA